MKDTTVSATLDKWTHLWSRGDGAEAGSCSLSARYKITPRICEMSSEENSILTVQTTDSIAPRSREICKCNLFSIFNIFLIFVFFLNVPEFCLFNSSTDM